MRDKASRHCGSYGNIAEFPIVTDSWAGVSISRRNGSDGCEGISHTSLLRSLRGTERVIDRLHPLQPEDSVEHHNHHGDN